MIFRIDFLQMLLQQIDTCRSRILLLIGKQQFLYFVRYLFSLFLHRRCTASHYYIHIDSARLRVSRRL